MGGLFYVHAGKIPQLDQIGRSLANGQRRMADICALQNAMIGLLSHIGSWLVLALAIPLVSGGIIPGVYLAALALIALARFEAVAPLPPAAQYLEGHLQAARRLFELVDAEPAVRDRSENNVAVIDYSEEQLGKEFKSIERLRKALKS